jgi:hypothetical protein
MHGLATDRVPKSYRIRSRTAMVELECTGILRGTRCGGVDRIGKWLNVLGFIVREHAKMRGSSKEE